MRETITLGATPCDEPCAQLNVTPNYHEVARVECQVYRRQLLRMYKDAHGQDLPDQCSLVITNESHDFGTYHEVGARYNDSFREAVEAAFWFDENVPFRWDETARKELEELIPGWKDSHPPTGEAA